MKKILLGAAALSVMLVSSCKKDDNSGPSNSFTLNGRNYMMQASSRYTHLPVGDILNSHSSSFSYFNLTFESFPTVAGSYTIVATYPRTGEVSIQASDIVNGDTMVYNAVHHSGVVTVTVNNSKITAIVPQVPALRNKVNSLQRDTVNISGNIIEQ